MVANRKKLIRIILFFLAMTIYHSVNAQAATPIECGTILEAELIPNEPLHEYVIQVPAGTVLNGSVEPIGNTFNLGIFFLDAGGSVFDSFNEVGAGVAEEFTDFAISSSNPKIQVTGFRPDNVGYAVREFSGEYFGAYTILLGCILRDGTVIEPGAIPPNNTGSDGGTTTVVTPPFSGTGFPGLAPVDFANAFKLPLSLGTAIPGSIPPLGDAVLGLTFDASAGDTFALDFTRTSGNLNLGIVVLSANNEVVFQASLVTSQSLSTQLTLPSAGQYTIGVFRIDLLPPAAPEATQFQITGTLNP